MLNALQTPCCNSPSIFMLRCPARTRTWKASTKNWSVAITPRGNNVNILHIHLAESRGLEPQRYYPSSRLAVGASILAWFTLQCCTKHNILMPDCQNNLRELPLPNGVTPVKDGGFLLHYTSLLQRPKALQQRLYASQAYWCIPHQEIL